MNEKDEFQYNNEEEAEMAQLHAIHLHLNAIGKVQEELAKQRLLPSLEECEDCGEDIPEQRREFIKGVTRCVHCQGLFERRQKGY